jgi:hypothetical protein
VSESMTLRGWKGERVNCQLLVWSAKGDGSISIEVGDLKSEGAKIDTQNLTVSAVGYVISDQFLNEKSKSCGPRDKTKIPFHLTPDVLTHHSSFTIGARQTRPVWISVNIPRAATAGLYRGEIRTRSSSGVTKHPVSLEVLDAVLPDPSDWSFHLDLWQNPFAVARYHGVELWSEEHFALLRPLLHMLAQAGQKCITTTLIDKPWNGGPCYDPFRSMIQWTKKRDGTWEYDYSIFDKYVSLAMSEGITKQINCYSMVPLTNKFSWHDEATSKTVTQQLAPGTEGYAKLWQSFLKDFTAHLTKKGWLSKTTVALDEREEAEMKEMFVFLKKVAPELKVSMAGFFHEDVNASIYDFCSNWRDVDKLSKDFINSRRQAGKKTTYYVACGIPKPNNFTFSPPAESCFEGWFASANGFDGFLRWAYNSWPEKPSVDSRFRKWPSGDTFMVYPNAQSSIRFERLREGIQDYEKIRILRDKLKQNASPEARAAEKRLAVFLEVINTQTLDALAAADVVNEGKRILHDIVKSGLLTAPGK